MRNKIAGTYKQRAIWDERRLQQSTGKSLEAVEEHEWCEEAKAIFDQADNGAVLCPKAPHTGLHTRVR